MRSAPTKAAAAKRRKRPVSVGKVLAGLQRRGRPASYRKINRLHVTEECNRLFASEEPRALELWFAAAVRALQDWHHAACAPVFDKTLLMMGELMVAGQRGGLEEPTQPHLLPATLEDAVAVARAVADGRVEGRSFTADATLAIFVDLLVRNVFPLAMRRAAEALGDYRHRYHLHVWQGFGQLIFDVVRVGFRPAGQPDEVPPGADVPRRDPVPLEKLAGVRSASVQHALERARAAAGGGPRKDVN